MPVELVGYVVVGVDAVDFGLCSRVLVSVCELLKFLELVCVCVCPTKIGSCVLLACLSFR